MSRTLKQGSSIRLHTGRKYYRTKTFWYCNPSRVCNDPNYFVELEKQRTLTTAQIEKERALRKIEEAEQRELDRQERALREAEEAKQKAKTLGRDNAKKAAKMFISLRGCT